MEMAQQQPDAFTRIVAAGKRCVEQDGADIIVLGCMSMAFLPGVAQRLQDELGCPVINPVLAALKTAEMAASLKIGQRWNGGPKLALP
jgi:allantoin racemase